MPIPDHIKREHILQAAAEIDAADPGSFQPSTKYDAWIDGKTYPPKTLIVRASHHAPGSPIDSTAFSGGDESGQANRFLRLQGIPVYPKGTDGPAQADYPEDSSRFGYLAWMLRDAAVYCPRNAFDCRKAFREAAYLLLGLATAGDHRGQTIENYYEAVNKRQIDVSRKDFYDAMAEAVRGDTARLTSILRTSSGYAHIFGTPRWGVMEQAIAALAAGGREGQRTYRLLTFNPSNKEYDYSLEDWSEVVAEISANKIAEDDWSTGSTTSVVEGDPFFFLCQGAGPRGIVGQAIATSDSWQDGNGRNRANISIDWATERPLQSLETTTLEARFPDYRWSPQGSGQALDPAIADYIEQQIADNPMVADQAIPSQSSATTTTMISQQLAAVLDTQKHYSSDNTPKMKKRLQALKNATSELKTLEAGQPTLHKLLWQPKDGTGRKARIPWIRLYDKKASPKPTQGWYIVFLFRSDGTGVYLSLNQGTQIWKPNGDLLSQPLDEIEKRAQQARRSLIARGLLPDQTKEPMDLRDPMGGRKLGEAYTRGDVEHAFYGRDELPDDATLTRDLLRLVAAYGALIEGRPPGPQPPPPPPPPPPEPVTPKEICHHFTQAVTTTGLCFGSRTDDFIRAFLASAATKRFVILTGLSGSGKTQIAMKLGEWLGEDAYMVVPVRPDWTGSEALFGYENVLAKADDNGRRPWQVPPTLEFMLEAVANPADPYLLLLDEMNLAHVERYFADVLSGIESGKACLPNLKKDAKGAWLQSAAEPMVPFPNNLFVVGTVNVDETTYMFSPKVLDRANTIEFRVQTSDLAADPLAIAAIAPCPQGAPAHTQGLRAIAADRSSHVELVPAWLEAFTADLRALHTLLARHGLEFGHRTFAESVRFACIHAAMLGEDEATGNHEQQLDLVVLQKVLPRLHGSRRRLEPVLCALASFAKQPKDKAKEGFDPLGDEAADPTLPKTMDKLQRMTRILRDNQFVSFAE